MTRLAPMCHAACRPQAVAAQFEIDSINPVIAPLLALYPNPTPGLGDTLRFPFIQPLLEKRSLNLRTIHTQPFIAQLFAL